MFKTKFGMNSLIDVRMWLSTFELAKQGLDNCKLVLAYICLFKDPVMVAIFQYLPQPYKYLDVKKALLKVFDSKAKNLIDRENFLEYQIKNPEDYSDKFRQMGPPKRSERLQARKALAQAISTTIENPTAKLYLLQSVESDNTDPQDDPDSPSIFVNVSISLPLQTILKVVPGLESALSSLREALNPQGVHTTLSRELHNPILRLCTWIEVAVFDTPIRAVLDTGAPINIISSHLVRRLGFLPDILYAESFIIAGVESIKSNGAYSSVPLRFDELVMT
ncbi:hypothetical protein DSO57_1026471 [Entomophthora muscae]|uniref:Uncharacterized protein n=1 Tax=Entomophthora muscae TaxID=34485 RepID=A0ACC2SR03_9FUNG|nr:hypothetical protein DSO57_1026471 [Entomophthora muscae]